MEACPTLLVCSMNICWRICETCARMLFKSLCCLRGVFFFFFHVSVLLYEVIISSIVFPHKHFLFFPLCSRRDVLSGVTLSWGFLVRLWWRRPPLPLGGALVSHAHTSCLLLRGGGSHLCRLGGETLWLKVSCIDWLPRRAGRVVGHDVRVNENASLRFCRAPLLSRHLSSRGMQVRSVCDTNKLKLIVMSHRVNRLHLGRLMRWITPRELRISRRRAGRGRREGSRSVQRQNVVFWDQLTGAADGCTVSDKDRLTSVRSAVVLKAGATAPPAGQTRQMHLLWSPVLFL